MDLIDKDLSKC